MELGCPSFSFPHWRAHDLGAETERGPCTRDHGPDQLCNLGDSWSRAPGDEGRDDASTKSPAQFMTLGLTQFSPKYPSFLSWAFVCLTTSNYPKKERPEANAIPGGCHWLGCTSPGSQDRGSAWLSLGTQLTPCIQPMVQRPQGWLHPVPTLPTARQHQMQKLTPPCSRR